ncbi:MAG TPA: 2-dehydropantoate 2-reductase [Phenylobacterium sp.]|nr:2-dehydropantoate 2-reductase [Phenylobacterium sp.]
MMKIAILGAGAMGSLFGGLLAESGQDVTLLDINDAHILAIREQGLRLQTEAGDRRIRALTACRPDQATAQPDLLVVFTKTLHTASALEGVAGLIGPQTLVLTLQNGLGNVETVSRFAPIERILIGMTTWPADVAGPGHVRSHGAGGVRIMAADQRQRPDVAKVAETLSMAGLNCTLDRTVWTAIWEKVAFNAALNSLCAVTGCTVDQLGAVPEGMALAGAVIDEVLAVARAEGIEADADHCRETVAHAIAHHIGHRPSMLQDVLAARPTEIGAINGAVVEKGLRHGVAVPRTETLLGLVRLIEARAKA